MTIACNSAYVQAETLYFTFAWQAVIVYFDANADINVLADYFVPIVSHYTLSKQSIRLLIYMLHTYSLFESQWFGVLWQQSGSKLRYVWQWAPKISWQPRLSPCSSRCSVQWDVDFACITCYIFTNFLQIPILTSNLLYLRKANETSFQQYIVVVCRPVCPSSSLLHTTYCAYGNIVNFSRTSQIHFCAKNTPFSYSNQWGKKIPQTAPSLGHLDLCLIHPFLHQPHSLPKTTAWSVHTLPHNCATKTPLVTMGRPKFAPKPPFLSTITTASNTQIPWLTPLTTP